MTEWTYPPETPLSQTIFLAACPAPNMHRSINSNLCFDTIPLFEMIRTDKPSAFTAFTMDGLLTGRKTVHVPIH